MRNLSDTLARLSAFRKMGNFEVGAVPSRLSDLRDFGSNPGNLSAKTYFPKDLPKNAPLVVVLHGCLQSAAVYDHGSGWSALAERHGFALLFPEQKRENNPNLCFNWFVPADVSRDGGEALSIRQMVDTVCRKADCDTSQIYVTGLSAGGAMTSAMLACYPEVFAGGAIIAGLPHGAAKTIPEAFDRMRGHGMPAQETLESLLRSAAPENTARWPKVSIWHGGADRTVVPANAEAIVGQWRGAHGLLQTAARREDEAGFARDVYVSADGVEQIEVRMISGMTHGTPLATQEGLGHAGPYMLEAGICSTSRIAQFWDIAPRSRADGKAVAQPAEYAEALSGEVLPPGQSPRAESAASSATHAPANSVKRIIEDALRAAGLMR